MTTFQELADELTKRVQSSETTAAAATAMAAALTDVAAGYLGGDLAMSGLGQRAVIEPASQGGSAVVRTAGAYALADGGRRAVRPARARRHSALNTPWGPRDSVDGSTWAGFGITDRARTDVLDAGKQAFREAVVGP